MINNGEQTSSMLLKTKDLQKYLNVGRDTALNMMSLPGFPCVTIGRTRYCQAREVDEWLKRNAQRRFNI